MKYSIKTSLAIIFAILFAGMSTALAFSFDFGDDDDNWGNPYWGTPGWGAPGWGNAYRPWAAPNGTYFYPRLPYFQRSRMVDNRQWDMGRRHDAMNTLGAMLYGRAGFDRTEAIKITRRIEATSGHAMNDNFHPGAIATYSSQTSLSLWGNQPAFKANSQALQQAAKALAEEFLKQPTAEEGAVLLPKSAGRPGQLSEEKVAVSADIWEKFNNLSNVCDSCHRGFRLFDW